MATTVRSTSSRRAMGSLGQWTNPANTTTENGTGATALCGTEGVGSIGGIFDGFQPVVTRALTGDSGERVPDPAAQTNGTLIVGGVAGAEPRFEIKLADSSVNNTCRLDRRPVTSTDTAINPVDTTLNANTTTNVHVFYTTTITGDAMDAYSVLNSNFGFELEAVKPVAELGNCTWNLDYVRFTVVWQLHVTRDGTITGGGTLSGTRQADAKRTGVTIGSGVLSGVRQVIASRSGGVGVGDAGAAGERGPSLVHPAFSDFLVGTTDQEFWVSGPEPPSEPGKDPAEGILSGGYDIERRFYGALIGGGSLSGSAKLEARKTGTISGGGIISGTRQVDARRTGAFVGMGRLSGVRQADTKRTGTLTGAGILSGVRRADTTRTGLIAGAGRLSGVRRVDFPVHGAIIGAGVLSGTRRADARRTGALLGTSVLSGARRADARRAGTLAGTGVLSGARRADASRTGALLGAGILSGVRRADRARTGLIAGAGILSGVRRADVARTGLIAGAGILSGVRRADIARTGLIAGMGRLSGVRTADARRSGALIGDGRLSGTRTTDTLRAGALIGGGVISGLRQVDVTKTGLISGEGILSGSRHVDFPVNGALIGNGVLSGTYLFDVYRSGAIIGGPGNKLKGWGIVVAYGLSGHTYNEDGTAIITGATVDLLRVDASQLTWLQRTISDGTGYFAFTLSSDPFLYMVDGHFDDGFPDGQHLVDTSDRELVAEQTQTQGPTQPSDD